MAPNTAGRRRCTAQPPNAHSGAKIAPDQQQTKRSPHGGMQARLSQIERQRQAGEQGDRQDIGAVIKGVLHQAFEPVQHGVGQVEDDRVHRLRHAA